MSVLGRTVLCWDGSEPADAAGRWAVRRWENTGADIEIVDVLDRGLFAGDRSALQRATVEEERRLADRVGELTSAHPGVVAGSTLLVGDPEDVLSEQTRPGTLVVVGTHRRVGPRGRYGWSMGARLAASADGPVAIVPVDESPEGRTSTEVVVGVDGSDTGRRALHYAAREAAAARMRLTVVHCWQEPLAGEPLIVPDDDFVDAQQTAHQELLDDHVRVVRLRHPSLRVEPVLLRSNPISGLRSRAAAAALLVVGSRQLTGWKRAWLGSVSHGLVLDISAPTIVVGPQTLTGA
ncbi:universal stress protein [Leifsonia sp. LS1]|uniref:universal stress protein n=1 Tax=Leifsonia sp. LS1 TaxID=2828483 RepID=UPI001CFCC4BA|nr:universal stress protein [Leifsonia sp. LS1]GIT81768.1 universal stress protein [Leifsonia sp. LS1]